MKIRDAMRMKVTKTLVPQDAKLIPSQVLNEILGVNNNSASRGVGAVKERDGSLGMGEGAEEGVEQWPQTKGVEAGQTGTPSACE
jgi:hypothetical protein